MEDRVEQFAAIRRDARVEGLSIRELATKYRVHRRTVSLAELNNRIRGWEAEDDHRRIADRIRTVGEDFAAEQPLLAPLPVEPFDPGLVLTPRVDRSSLITVRMVKYSVPVRFIGRKVRVSLRANEVTVFDGRTPVAAHPRIATRTGTSVALDHYSPHSGNPKEPQ